MKFQMGEIISGLKVRRSLQSLVASHHPCKVKIPKTPFSWEARISEIREEGNRSYLFIEGVRGFEQALPPLQEQKVTLEYTDAQVFFCHFHSGVVDASPQSIWVECPEVIYRMQRRAYHRIKAMEGTEIAFSLEAGAEVKARVRDYSLGGVAFFAEADLSLKPEDHLKGLLLRIPEKGDWFMVEILLAIVRRVESPGPKGMNLYALEFLNLEEMMRKRFRQHLVEIQRHLLRKFKKGSPAVELSESLRA
ncbi:MAG: flagellar brake protein [Planctomycetaceae bacterium]